ncbi:NAD(P)H-hydrate epimerase, partial [Candidatus Omnitrophota bacterium]
KGLKVDVFILAGRSAIKLSEPLINLSILEKTGVRIKEITGDAQFKRIEKNFRYDFIVDAIFGIGFRGVLSEPIARLVGFLNSTKRPIYALDVPSGLDATTGRVEGPCVIARKTITFGLLKTGLVKKGAKRYTGKVLVKDIGLPIVA